MPMQISLLSIERAVPLVPRLAPVEWSPVTIKTVVGCIKGTPHHYQLSTTTKTGKAQVYDFMGDRDFREEVGHRVDARGAVSRENVKITTLTSLGSNCR